VSGPLGCVSGPLGFIWNYYVGSPNLLTDDGRAKKIIANARRLETCTNIKKKGT
jgi:hypothetical protein